MGIIGEGWIGKNLYVSRCVTSLAMTKRVINEFRPWASKYLKRSENPNRVFLMFKEDKKENPKAISLELEGFYEWEELENSKKLDDLAVLLYAEVLREVEGKNVNIKKKETWASEDF